MTTMITEPYLPPDLPPSRVAARIGIISDTHMPERCAALPTAVFDVLRGVDLVLHAGDVGELAVLDRLSAIAPVIAVHGNDETSEAQQQLPYQQVVVVAGQRIVVTHAHYPDRQEELRSRRDDAWQPKLERRAAFGRAAGAAIVVFGHTHIPMTYDYDGMLLLNPGAIASGNAITRQRRRTVALLYLRDDGRPYVTHVDLDAPGQAYIPQIDWSAGFRRALDIYSESILDPELERVMAAFRTLAGEAPDMIWPAVLRAAHPCWAGTRRTITRADVLSELRQQPGIAPTLLARLERLLSGRL